MSEMEATHFCNSCNKNTLHMFSGSGRKGFCLTCDNKLPEEEKADLSKVFSYTG